jgi:uncharacterized membrane protein YccC
MPSGQSPRQRLLARHSLLQSRIDEMSKDLPPTRGGAETPIEKVIQRYSNMMGDIATSIRQCDPSYNAIRRRLSKIEDGLDTNAARLSRTR